MVCEQCGRNYESKRSTARYCSPACRVKASRVSVTDDRVSVTKPLSVTPKSVTVKVAGQVLELGKAYSTDKDNRWSTCYDISEAGFKRRNKNWGDKSEVNKEAIRVGSRERATALIERITVSRAMRMDIIRQCEA